MLLSCYVVSDSYEIPLDCSPPDSSVHGISQIRILEWVHCLLQGIFLTQGSNPSLIHVLHWQEDSLPQSHLGSPALMFMIALFFFFPAKEHGFAFVVVLGL